MAVQKTDKPITALQESYQRFWEGFNLYTKDNPAFCKEFSVHPYPSIRPYQDYHIGKPGAEIIRKGLEFEGIFVKSYLDLLAEARLYNNDIQSLY